MARAGAEKSRPDRPAEAPAKQDFIADNLRSVFRSVESEPLPDKIAELLAQLAQIEKGRAE